MQTERKLFLISGMLLAIGIISAIVSGFIGEATSPDSRPDWDGFSWGIYLAMFVSVPAFLAAAALAIVGVITYRRRFKTTIIREKTTDK